MSTPSQFKKDKEIIAEYESQVKEGALPEVASASDDGASSNFAAETPEVADETAEAAESADPEAGESSDPDTEAQENIEDVIATDEDSDIAEPEIKESDPVVPQSKPKNPVLSLISKLHDRLKRHFRF